MKTVTQLFFLIFLICKNREACRKTVENALNIHPSGPPKFKIRKGRRGSMNYEIYDGKKFLFDIV